MAATILIFNKIRNLGRFTKKSLEERGFKHVTDVNSFQEATQAVASSEGKVIFIMELTPAWNKQSELDFIAEMKEKYQKKLVLFLCTTEEMNSEVQGQFQNMGISEFIFQRFDIDQFGEELEQAIKKHSPGSYKETLMSES